MIMGFKLTTADGEPLEKLRWAFYIDTVYYEPKQITADSFNEHAPSKLYSTRNNAVMACLKLLDREIQELTQSIDELKEKVNLLKHADDARAGVGMKGDKRKEIIKLGNIRIN